VDSDGNDQVLWDRDYSGRLLHQEHRIGTHASRWHGSAGAALDDAIEHQQLIQRGPLTP
jgi:hypothetical protein